jgi:hypothetical protein
MQHHNTSCNSNIRQKLEYAYLETCTELTPKFKQHVTYSGFQSDIKFTGVQIKRELT